MPVTLSVLIPGFELWWARQSIAMRMLVTLSWLMFVLAYSVGFLVLTYGLVAASTGVAIDGLVPLIVFYAVTLVGLLVYLVYKDAKD